MRFIELKIPLIVWVVRLVTKYYDWIYIVQNTQKNILCNWFNEKTFHSITCVIRIRPFLLTRSTNNNNVLYWNVRLCFHVDLYSLWVDGLFHQDKRLASSYCGVTGPIRFESATVTPPAGLRYLRQWKVVPAKEERCATR